MVPNLFPNEIISIAIYGSYARKDFDENSDKDLLIIVDKNSILQEVEEKYSELGWSCSAYTPERITDLSKKGYLFIKHLQLESEIQIDYNSFLENILKTFSVKSTYAPDLKEAVKFLNCVKYIPNNNMGIGWAYDMLLISLKNIFIYQFAEKQEYIFSVFQIGKQLEEQNIISKEENNSFCLLRKFKHEYRKFKNDYKFEKTDLFIITKMIHRLFDIDVCQIVEPSSYGESVKQLMNSEIVPYGKLRLFEAILISRTRKETDLLPAEVQKFVDNPKFYIMKFKDNKNIEQLLKKYKNKV